MGGGPEARFPGRLRLKVTHLILTSNGWPSQRSFTLPIVAKAGPQPCQGFADAGQKPPALDTTVDLPSDPEMRAKGFSERLVLIERLN